jgi:hypothetical protein
MPRSTAPKGSPRSNASSRAEKAAPAPARSGFNGSRPPVSVEEIARRAYELYEARGKTDGAQVDDWLRAEQQLAQDDGAAGIDHVGPLTAAKRKRSTRSGSAAQ